MTEAEQTPGETGVSVIIPTYNEQETIRLIIERVLDALADYPLEVLVVDDDSPDGTWWTAADAYADDDRVRVIRRTDARGLGTAVSRGFHEARYEYCAVIDADLQHPPEKLPDLFDALADADIAVGSRYVSDGGIENWSWTRKVVSRGATSFAKAGVPSARGVTDPMSGFFAVRRSIVTDVDLAPRGYKILLELLAKCEVADVVEVPYVFRERTAGESNLTAGEYQKFAEHVVELAGHSYGLDRVVSSRRFVRAVEFGAVGALGAVVNFVIFTALHLGVGVHYLAAGVAAFIAALNFNFVGNWLVTFDRPSDGLWGKYYRFNAVSLAGFVLYTAVLTTTIRYLLLPALVANGLAIGGSALFNFLGIDSYAFDATQTDPDGAST
jgi:dolichol-phosphate mannosyltransferase